jgi:hypothetical protein
MVFVPPEHIDVMFQRENIAKMAAGVLKPKYAKVLKAVRSGKSGSEELWRLLQEYRDGSMSPEKLAAGTGRISRKDGIR